MKERLENIVNLQSGLFAKPDIQPDTLYLQGVHFNPFGEFNPDVKPQVNSKKVGRHILKSGDILFAAKGLNNFAVVYDAAIGKAVASSSFITMEIKEDVAQQVVPEYLAWYFSYAHSFDAYHKQMGTTIPSISITKLKELEISIPTVERQHRIVEIQKLRNLEKQLVYELDERKDQLIRYQLLMTANQ